jgi:hypothetical protein
MDYVIRGGLKAGDLKAGGGLKEDGREARESDCGGKTRQIKLNRQSPDPRVKELEAIFAGSGYNVADLNDAASGRTIYFFEPRCRIDCGVFDGAAVGSIAFGYAKELPECAAASGIKYVCLSDDETFVQRNNYLTALALKQIIGDKEYGRPKRGADGQPKQGVRPKRKMLVCGWGKLAGQIEKVFDGWDIHILNFNIHKVPELTDKYGSRAYFETAPFEKFCIVVNTIPKEVIRAAELPKRKTQTIYDLASPPYGFNWKGADKADFNYRVEPALPGRYFPRQAAEAVAECIQRHLETLVKPTVVLCITGSSCSYLKLLPILKDLAAEFDILPVLSENANVPNRFTDIDGFKDKIREITGHNIITNIAALAESLLHYFLSGSNNKYSKDDAADALLEGDVDRAMNALRTIFASIPYGIHLKDERYYQTIVHLVFRMMGLLALSEVQTADGRIDTLVETRKYVYCFEFKLNGSADEALAQIDSKEYLLPWHGSGKKLVKVGVSFDYEKRNVKEWLVSEQ